MEEMATRKRQLLLRRRKRYARPICFLKDLSQVFKTCNPREAFHGWWPLLGRTSSKQGTAKLFLHLSMKQRGDNCKKKERIAEGTRDVLGKSCLGPWTEQQCKMKTLQQDLTGARQEVSALEKGDGDSNTGGEGVHGERWGRP